MPDTPASDTQREWLSLVTARIRDAYLRKPFYVDGGQDLVSVCRLLSQQGLTNALVRDGDRLGMFTTTDLRDALLRAEPPAELPVREVAHFDLIEVQADAELFEALWLMVRHRVHRLLVRDGEAVLGVLGQLDLVSFVSNHSHIVALQIDEARSVAELKQAALRIDAMIALLHEGGIRIDRIARVVSELNARLFARLWSLLAPAELVANSCLLVMGSEGRGEQILKTDQDNALLLRDGFDCDGLDALTLRFSEALGEFGYPPCPGGIMLSNARWRQPLVAFRATLREWVHGATDDGPLNLAIFFDASAVAGDATLLREAQAQLERLLVGSDAFLARFAAAADQFSEPGGWWTRLTQRQDEQPLDLKKLGTFPIVHGVRALALRHGVRAPGTLARLQALVAAGQLEPALAQDLGEALQALMAMKLDHQLAQRRAGGTPGNLVLPAELSTLERDRLKDALAIVRRFRELLRHRFRLDSL
ncbi:putative nucleotidyltransferase substrate binding domain-containing protein [Rivibacter subsaxonicus]|uniref:CBS domain-containing protein n=1 Tax=Rivibacter subsaxonicus TaxID=457575 RepID=A0A4Q7W0S6_9BURK|nr:putative nucleotidyltransferase substrate binding domain-containing protein [Rivibacter subsaxonicus]RZU02119.1 CBS domain-containing protein [Rivibacter subsaxonicus]